MYGCFECMQDGDPLLRDLKCHIAIARCTIESCYRYFAFERRSSFADCGWFTTTVPYMPGLYIGYSPAMLLYPVPTTMLHGGKLDHSFIPVTALMGISIM
jgi:hypothetical protein